MVALLAGRFVHVHTRHLLSDRGSLIRDVAARRLRVELTELNGRKCGCKKKEAAKTKHLLTYSPQPPACNASIAYESNRHRDTAWNSQYFTWNKGILPKCDEMNKRSTGVPQFQDNFRLGSEGLAKVLGDLEARVMRTVWDFEGATPAREIYLRVAQSHDVASLTVVTVLNKLVRKGFLRRFKRDDLFHYEPRWSEADFLAHASRRIVEEVLAFEPDAVAASFVDVLAERDPERLAELARVIRRRLRDESGDR